MDWDAYEENERRSGGAGARLQAVDLAGPSSSVWLVLIASS